MIILLGWIFNSCHHTNCRFAPPKFSKNEFTVSTSLSVQNIKPVSYEPNIEYHWYVISTPTIKYNRKREASRSYMLSYIFNEVGTYQLQLNSSKSGCEAESVPITVYSKGTASIPFPCSSTPMNILNIDGQRYDASTPRFSNDSFSVTVGDYFFDNITIGFSTPFFKQPVIGDYIIVNVSGHKLSSKECNVSIESAWNRPTNAPFAVVHVIPGVNKNYQICICNFQYDNGWRITSADTKFEFD